MTQQSEEADLSTEVQEPGMMITEKEEENTSITSTVWLTSLGTDVAKSEDVEPAQETNALPEEPLSLTGYEQWLL